MGFLPISAAEMQERGWDTYDFLLVSADAYVDHPSFGHAIIARVLEKEGFRVAIWRVQHIKPMLILQHFRRHALVF